MIGFRDDATLRFARQGKSFHFASRLLPPAQRSRVAAVYAYCRTTDDIVDDSHGDPVDAVHARLDAWLTASRAAYDGAMSGVSIIDEAMPEMRDRAIPFRIVEDLVAGMRMDLEPRRYRHFAELSVYTYRVAGVVGLWMAQMFGEHEPWMLSRAVALGRAMQITNIVRDVGEDLDRGRLYLPQALLRSCAVSERDLGEMRAGRRAITPGYRAVVEAMMTVADADYRRGLEAVPHLSPAFRRTVAVAAELYRGIHAEVRRADYDTLTRRASTTLARKCLIAVNALRRWQAVTDIHAGNPLPGVA